MLHVTADEIAPSPKTNDNGQIEIDLRTIPPDKPVDFPVFLTPQERLENKQDKDKNPNLPDKEIKHGKSVEDITVFVAPEKHKELATFCGKSEECEVSLILNTERDNDGKEIQVCYAGRGLIASCLGGKRLSVTIRQSNKERIRFANKPDSKINLGFPDVPIAGKSDAIEESPFAPRKEPGEFAYSVSDIYKVISDRFGSQLLGKGGLIVVSGRTGSGKSQIVRALIAHALSQSLTDPKRHPHLLTIEDPIEMGLFKQVMPEEIQAKYGIDYTPRHKIKDIIPKDGRTPLQQALGLDALRQTPTVVFVGETREEADWKEVLRFAETGQLILTTTHAGSVRETLQKILVSVDAKTRADEGRYAGLINGIIHIEKMKVSKVGIEAKEGIVPALWLGNTAGVSALIADGLSSVLPNSMREESAYSIGRKWFLEEMIEKNLLSNPSDEIRKTVFARDLFDR